MHIRRCVIGLLLLVATLAAGCHGGVDNSTASVAPAGLTERDPSVVYAQGTAIIPDTSSNSGGPITQCSVVPPLPAGLVLDPQTCAITGTPTTVSDATIYTVTGSNAAGSDSARLEIEVKDTSSPPEDLSYLDSSVVYQTNQPITPDTPITTGGEITQCSVSPPLPPGLVLNPQTCEITGTPTATTPQEIYTVTGSNSADSAQTPVSIAVEPQVVPPASVTYSDTAPVLVVGQPFVGSRPGRR
jgi:hypothetical protein